MKVVCVRAHVWGHALVFLSFGFGGAESGSLALLSERESEGRERKRASERGYGG